MDFPIPVEMTLTRLLQTFIEELGWDADISLKPDHSGAHYESRLSTAELNARLAIEVDEARCCISVWLSNEITVPERRYAEALELANAINARTRRGCVVVTARQPFCFRHTVDLDGLNPTAQAIKQLVDTAVCVLGTWQEEMGRVVFTRTTAKALLAEIDAGVEDDIDRALPPVRPPSPSTVQ